MTTFLQNNGGYKHLRAYIQSEIIYDLSVYFTEKFIRKGSRTRDQIEQAARSGKQNIAEGSVASTTSRETEIKLTNVAKASLEELLLDYEDYLRQNGLPQWEKNHPRTLKLRQYLHSESFISAPMLYARKMNAEEFCNLCITLINQTTYLLRKLIISQQEQFLREGGIREQMHAARVNYRNQLRLNEAEGMTSRTSMTSKTSNFDPTSPTRPTGPIPPCQCPFTDPNSPCYNCPNRPTGPTCPTKS